MYSILYLISAGVHSEPCPLLSPESRTSPLSDWNPFSPLPSPRLTGYTAATLDEINNIQRDSDNISFTTIEWGRQASLGEQSDGAKREKRGRDDITERQSVICTPYG